ncbi:MAG: transcriptional regulator [Silicimonas sp.]|nr:transcriptional regulator [Silicimonas sp.]
MSSINHHLTDALLMSYASGTLDEGFSIVVATHVSLCDECRARMESFEAVGGSLVDEVDAVEMGEDSLEATMALIDAAPEFDIAPKVSGKVLPQPLFDYIGGDLDDVHWKPVGGGVRQSVLNVDGGSQVRLLSIPGGAAMPDHGHNGLELTLVLQGAFKDDDDRFARGDIEIADEDLHHTPIAEAGQDCICLAATDAPLRFKGLLPRIAQRFVGI